MLSHHLKVGYRSLIRQQSYAIINMLGLTLGIMSAIIIFLIVRYELSFDTFHERGDRIYRVVRGLNLVDADSGTPHRVMEILQAEVPEIEQAAVAFKLNPRNTQVEVNDYPTRAANIAFTTPSFFEMFSYAWKAGNPRQSLSEPGQVVIDETLAIQWFNGDAIGQVIRLDDVYELTVTGVLESMPVNTDFPIQMAVSHATYEQSGSYDEALGTGANSYYQTFITLREDASVSEVEARFPGIVEKYVGKEVAERIPLLLQPLSNVHYNEELGDTNFSGRAVNKNIIFTLGLIGFLIMLAACINFVNLTTARAVKRAKEVGVRKVLGSEKVQLVAQFLVEAFLMTLAATLLATVLTRILIQPIANYLSIPINPSMLWEPEVLLLVFGGWLLISLLPGMYPAFLLARFSSIATVLKSSLQRKQGGGLFLRRGLIVVQFTITFLLIICTVVVLQQLDYIRTKSLGFNKEAVVTVDMPANLSGERELLRQTWMQHASVQGVSFSLNTPSATINKWWTSYRHPTGPEDGLIMEHKAMDEAYLDLFDIELLAGRNIQASDSFIDVVINESMMRAMGIEDPQEAIGETVSFWSVSDAPVVGVVKDFHTVSLHQPIHSVMLWQGFDRMNQKASIKIEMQQAKQAISHIENGFKDVFPDTYFSYAFLDDELDTFYAQEEKTSRALALFAFIAICIGSLGLYGLVSFMATQKIKEIGIRKILGASYASIIRLFVNEFSLLLLIAFVVASPIAYIAMQQWMQNFTFRTDIQVTVFLTAIAAGMAITALSIGYQSVKAALVNPVDNLRHE